SYQLSRIQCLFDPSSDVTGACYQLTQSMRAIGSGQLLGKGFLADQSMTSFEYVPEQQTDFIFTAVAEQVGLFGSLVVLAAFAVVLCRPLPISAHARHRSGALVGAGVAAMTLFHVYVT